jgi:polysaccharide export outer membrane protein
MIALATSASPVSAGDYVIGEGDGLIVDVWGVKELNVAVTVRPDGKITVPGIGDIPAAGYTPTELQGVLGTKLKELVKNPIVTVTVKEITNSKVYIFGGGVKAGVFNLNQRATLLQLLCALGDVKVADLKNSYILRKGKKIKTDFHKLFITGDMTEDITLETNDSLFIPLLAEKNVYVMGAVGKPRFIEYREGLTVMESILEAGGFSKFAKENDTVIIRKDGAKEITIPVRAKDLVKDGDLSQNVKLQPGDYVIVKEGMF